MVRRPGWKDRPGSPTGRTGFLARTLLALGDVPRPGGTASFEPDSPMAVEHLADPRRIDEVIQASPATQVPSLSVTSSFDLPLMPGGWSVPHATDACPVPVIHPNLPYSADLLDRAEAFLDGRPQPSCPAWRRAFGPLSRVFTAP